MPRRTVLLGLTIITVAFLFWCVGVCACSSKMPSNASETRIPEPTGAAEGAAKPTPPVVRSVLQLGAQMSMVFAKYVHGAPGMQGGIFVQGRPYCFAVGFRDAKGSQDIHDKSNHLRLRDPLGVHRLTMPVTAFLAWLLHNEKVVDLQQPITSVLSDLPSAFAVFTFRDILQLRAGLNDSAIYRHLEIGAPAADYWNVRPQTPLPQSVATNVWKPLNQRFGSDPVQARKNFCEWLKEALPRLPVPRRLAAHAPAPSHFAFALLCSALEKAAKKPFEELMSEKVFVPLQAPSIGFGAPALVNRSQLFYQMGGLAPGHSSFHTPVAIGDPSNAAAALFNGSLNLFGNADDIGKCIIMAAAAAVKAVEVFERPTVLPYYELAVRCNRARHQLQHMETITAPDNTPFAASFFYDTNWDMGGFAVANCGTRLAKLSVNMASGTLGRFCVRERSSLIDALRSDESGKGVEDLKRLDNERKPGMFASMLRSASNKHTRL